MLTRFIESAAHVRGGELPGKSFFASPGFEEHQTGEGALTHEFRLGGVSGRRMVVPYQIWMLQRLEEAIARCAASVSGRKALEDLLGRFEGGQELLDVGVLLAGCRVRKQGGLLYSVG